MEPEQAETISVIIPAKNEGVTIGSLVANVLGVLPNAEVIVVDDGSSDSTASTAEASGARVVANPHSMGNGAAIKAGARAAKGSVLVFMDGDGQHLPEEIPRLLEKFRGGYGMVVAARSSGSQASIGRLFANGAYNFLASLITGHRIPDLTSGFRVVDADRFKKFLYLLPNGFSYPTTITMAFMRAGFPVAFVDFEARQREGRGHIRPMSDGLRFLIIIFKIATLYSPLKLFLPAAAVFFMTGTGYYLFTYLTMGRFTNMSMLLLSASVIIFLIGLISEQITALMYKDE